MSSPHSTYEFCSTGAVIDFESVQTLVEECPVLNSISVSLANYGEASTECDIDRNGYTEFELMLDGGTIALYLEISPIVLYVTSDTVSTNDVYSNTNWSIE